MRELEIKCRRRRNRIESLVQHVVIMRGAYAFVVRIVDTISRLTRSPRFVERAGVVRGE